MINTHFIPTRESALKKLHDFVPRAGIDYTKKRNYDFGPQQRENISMLSPYIRSRLLREYEVIDTVLKNHTYAEAEKFVQEVLWRTYWKGWLEMRPTIWESYLKLVQDSQQNEALMDRYHQAIQGETDIACMNLWAKELRTYGYLHNHARMWFASIWIFTLKLPWWLGARFFLEHLLDGDPASNTLSWRWVAGLQTKGKHYLAQRSNIEKFTDGRIIPTEPLSQDGEALSTEETFSKEPLEELPERPTDSEQNYTLILHEEDLIPSLGFIPAKKIQALVLLQATYSCSELVASFRSKAIEDTIARFESDAGHPLPKISYNHEHPDQIKGFLKQYKVRTLHTIQPNVGFTKEELKRCVKSFADQDVSVLRYRRIWDSTLYPYATKGFFHFKKMISEESLSNLLNSCKD